MAGPENPPYRLLSCSGRRRGLVGGKVFRRVGQTGMHIAPGDPAFCPPVVIRLEIVRIVQGADPDHEIVGVLPLIRDRRAAAATEPTLRQIARPVPDRRARHEAHLTFLENERRSERVPQGLLAHAAVTVPGLVRSRLTLVANITAKASTRHFFLSSIHLNFPSLSCNDDPRGPSYGPSSSSIARRPRCKIAECPRTNDHT